MSFLLFAKVTRSISRACSNANIQQLSKFSIVIKRNPRLDALALQQRQVIVHRRASAQPIQGSNILHSRRLSLAQLPGTAHNARLIMQSNVNNGVVDIIQENNNQPNDIEMYTTNSSPDNSSNVDGHQNENDEVTMPSNDIQPVEIQTATSNSFCEPSPSTSGQSDNDGIVRQEKTFFPGYKETKTRYSFFNRDDMDKYVQKFQSKPVLNARRFSMPDNRPTTSRFNRFSLDSIPE